MSGGRREPNGPPPPPRLPPPPPQARRHCRRRRCHRRRRPRGRRCCCSTPSFTSGPPAASPGALSAFDFRSRCIYVTAATPAIKRRHNIARPRKQAPMAEITESAVRKVLDAVIDPATAKSVVAQGMVGGIAVRGGHVAVTLDVDPARGTALEPLRQACEQAVRAMPGVLSATAVMTSERPAAGCACARARTRHGHGPRPRRSSRQDHRRRRPHRRAGREAHHRRGLGQGRRRQVDDGGQPRARPRRQRRQRPACSMPTSTARRCRACSTSRRSPNRSTARR